MKERILVHRAREMLDLAKLSNYDPDVLEWAEIVQQYLEEALPVDSTGEGESG